MHLPLDKNEIVLFTFRKHGLVLLLELLPSVLLFLLPFALYAYAAHFPVQLGGSTLTVALPTDVLIFLGSVWALLFWMRVAGDVTRYYLDAWVVTSDHLMDIEQVGLFHRQTSVLRLDRIQDITVLTPGILSTFFHFGNIYVQTAGAEREFVMRGIRDAKHVREVILSGQDALFHRDRDPSAPDRRTTHEVDV